MIKKLMMLCVAAMAMGVRSEVYYDYYVNGDGDNTITLSAVYVDGVMPNQLVIPSEYHGFNVTRTSLSLEDSDFQDVKSVVLPNSLLAIEDNIFVDCMQLERVDVVPGGRYKTRDNMLLSVDEKELVAVYGKASFNRTSLTIPDTVEEMGYWALFDSQKLKSIEIPKNVREIKGNPFVCCYSLEQITIHPENQHFKVLNECLLSMDGKRLIALAGSYKKKRQDIVVPEGVEEIGRLSLTSDMVDIRNVWLPTTMKKIYDALEWGGNGGKNDEYGTMENVVFQSKEKFEVVDGECLFCDCDINNVWFAGPVPKNFYSGDWWECGNVRRIHYTAEYKNEWEKALRNIGYANRGQVNRLEDFPKQPTKEEGGDSSLVVPDAASVYDGYLMNGSVVAGTVQAKVSKPKKGEAKVTVALQITGEKKLSIKGQVNTSTGAFTGEAKDGRVLSLTFGMNKVEGNFGSYEISGARNLFSSKDKAEKAEAEELLAPWIGTLNMFVGGEAARAEYGGALGTTRPTDESRLVEDNEPYQSGTLSVTVAKKGKVTVKGTVDGVKVSAKAQALIGEDWICIPVVYSKKTLTLAFSLWLPIDGGEVKVVGLDGVVIGKAGTLEAGAEFYIDDAILSDIDGIIRYKGASILPDGESVSASGKKWVVAGGAKAAKVAYKKGELIVTPGKKGGEVANASGLKLTYKAKDGSFTGSFTVYALEGSKLKKHKASVSGILIEGIGYGTATIKKLGSWSVEIR